MFPNIPARLALAGFVASVVTVGAGAAAAQTPPQSGVGPLSGGQGVTGQGTTTHDEQHGTTLGAPPPQNGVIRPPVDPDPAMKQAPPAHETFQTPVISPPGTPGGAPNAVPK
jgi:hypothetical protein